MKRTYAVLLPVFVLAAAITPNFTRAQSSFTVTERGANYQVLQKTTVEHGTNRLHQYTELATGLNYQNSYGQWTESQEQISILPNGGAAAVQGQHQVYFPADIYNGVLEVVTPDGRHLKSRPLGVSYDDSSNTVFIATLTNSIGVLTASNQVTYPNAFTGIKADLVCTYRRGGFECDLVFREKPPTPDAYGLDASFSTLQLVTEFFNTQDPQQIPGAYDEWYGLQDDTLKFGKLTMTHGNAFAVGNPRPSAGRGQGEGNVSVYKRWFHLQGRTFLIEEAPLVYLADDLQALPEATSSSPSTINFSTINSHLRMASNHRQMPPAHEFVSDTNRILVAIADLNNHPGVVLDYDEMDTDTNDFTFQADMTYFINGAVHIGGTTTFEGGTVVKYPDDITAYIELDGLFTCPDTTDRPAIFTAADDDSVGESMNGVWGGYTGNPQGNYYANPALFINGDFDWWDNPVFGTNFNNIRIYYAQQAISAPSEWSSGQPIVINNSQIINCSQGVVLTSSWDNQVTCNNCLIANVNTAFVTYNYDGTYDYYYLSHCTIDNCSQLVNDAVYSMDELISPTNSIFSNVGAWTIAPDPWFVAEDFGWGENNGFYNTPSPLAGDNSIVITDYPFQAAGAANYYLTNGSPYRDVGTTDIDPDLLAEIQTMTTYAPPDGGWPDTNTPDLGYHYSVNEDSDYDGLPDWWEWKYFGGYTNSGSGLDSTGNHTLSYDYINGFDPNIISFSFSVTNQYVNAATVNATITILGGTPSYVAVLVNDTNQADASWQPYTSSNIVATLGSTDGTYTVSIGLRGLPVDALQTWESQTVFKETAAPVLTITNPTGSTVSTPLIQLQGLADESLSSLTFDVSNAAGIFTNQTGYWQPAFYDASQIEFTTNTFQCYDVPLTNGLNTITLHATDLAGNTVTTNVSYTLDYSGDTTAPILSVIWPTNGTSIAGSNFTMQAQVDDVTATVTASITDTNGDTNTVQGLVERGGAVWFNNLPLNSGTNMVMITATDAAGNASGTNLAVVQSSVNLTIDPLTDNNAPNQPSVMVTGSVNNPDDNVTVNGVAATVNDDGTWEADFVPVSATGTASLDVEVSDAGNNLLASQNNYQPQPASVVLMSYAKHVHDDETAYNFCSGGRSKREVLDEVVDWTYASGGADTIGVFGINGDCEPDSGANPPNSIAEGLGGYSPAWENNDFIVSENVVTVIGYRATTKQTKVMILPSGQQSIGQTALYLVMAQVINEDTGLQLAAGAVKFMNQLAGSIAQDVTNDDGSVWTEAVVSGASGAQTEVTPIVDGNISFTGMKISPAIIVYISVDTPPNSITGYFDANTIQSTLQSELLGNVFDSPPAGHSVQVQVVKETTPSGKPGWNGNPKTSYFNRVTWGPLIGNDAFSDHLGNTKIDTIQINNYYAAHGGTPSAQSWANYFVHEVFWLNAGGNHDCIISCVDGEISSRTEDAYSAYTALFSSRSVLRNEFGF